MSERDRHEKNLSNDEGGEAACYAHLVADARDVPMPVSLAAILNATAGHGPVWSRRADDLDLNVIVLTPEHGIDRHVNAERDVLLVAIEGHGQILIDEYTHTFGAGQIMLVPKGAARELHAITPRFAYLTCHRHRPPLLPTPRPRPR